MSLWKTPTKKVQKTVDLYTPLVYNVSMGESTKQPKGATTMKITFECFYQGEARRKPRLYEVEADENDIKDNFITLDNKVWEHFITFDMPVKDSVDDWNMRIVKKEA